jgi:hypothetical protein
VIRYGWWRALVLLLATSAGTALLAWWWAQPVPAPRWASAAAGVGGLVSLACLAGLWRTPALTLHWDRQRWHVARDGAAEQPGELAVAIDLGACMLLRFVPVRAGASSPWHRRTQWIALQRRGLEAHWHALRCALYAARPASPRAPEDEGA